MKQFFLSIIVVLNFLADIIHNNLEKKIKFCNLLFLLKEMNKNTYRLLSIVFNNVF